jgi:hypothetical protein
MWVFKKVDWNNYTIIIIIIIITRGWEELENDHRERVENGYQNTAQWVTIICCLFYEELEEKSLKFKSMK